MNCHFLVILNLLKMYSYYSDVVKKGKFSSNSYSLTRAHLPVTVNIFQEAIVLSGQCNTSLRQMWRLFVEVNRKVWKWRHSVKIGTLCWCVIKCRSKMLEKVFVVNMGGSIKEEYRESRQAERADWSGLKITNVKSSVETDLYWVDGKTSTVLKHVCSLVGGVRAADLDVWKCFALRKTKIKSSGQNSKHAWCKS